MSPLGGRWTDWVAIGLANPGAWVVRRGLQKPRAVQVGLNDRKLKCLKGLVVYYYKRLKFKTTT